MIRAELRFKNASFMNALKNSNYKSVVEFARESGLSYHKLIAYANLKYLFESSNSRKIMTELLDADEWTLFEQYREVVEKTKGTSNKVVTDVPVEKLIYLSSEKILQLQEPKEIEQDMIYTESLNMDMNNVLKTLGQREAGMVKMYYGIDRSFRLTLREIAKNYNLTHTRVGQIIEKSIRRLRHGSRSKFLRTYLNG